MIFHFFIFILHFIYLLYLNKLHSIISKLQLVIYMILIWFIFTWIFSSSTIFYPKGFWDSFSSLNPSFLSNILLTVFISTVVHCSMYVRRIIGQISLFYVFDCKESFRSIGRVGHSLLVSCSLKFIFILYGIWNLLYYVSWLIAMFFITCYTISLFLLFLV